MAETKTAQYAVWLDEDDLVNAAQLLESLRGIDVIGSKWQETILHLIWQIRMANNRGPQYPVSPSEVSMLANAVLDLKHVHPNAMAVAEAIRDLDTKG